MGSIKVTGAPTVVRPRRGRAEQPDIHVSVSRAISQLRDRVANTHAELADMVARIAPPTFGAREALLLARGARAWGVIEPGRVPHRAATADDQTLDAMAARAVLQADDTVLVTVRPGEVVLVLDGVVAAGAAFEVAARTFADVVELILQAIEQRQTVRDTGEEVLALHQAATDILSVRHGDEVLLSITRTAHRLLGADIAGIFLRDGDELVMQSCVGNRSVDFRTVRVKSGQGLAGRVLQTGQPVQVDNYIHSDLISDDFNWLVRRESIRSACGAPLSVRGNMIGVLEVWRRRRSEFTPRQVQRLVAMASLVTIAIENARLNDAQVSNIRQLQGAYDSLEQQVDAQRRSTMMQRELIQLLLEGEGLSTVARTVATLTGAKVAILTTSHEPLASYPQDLDLAVLHTELSRVSPDRSTASFMTVELPDGGGWLSVRAIHATGDTFGYVCLISATSPGDALEMAVGQAAVISALYCLEQRAADEARADARDEIIWDLLNGSLEYRRAAANRAERLRIDLHRAHRLFTCQLEGVEAIGGHGGEASRIDRVRHEVRSVVQKTSAAYGGPDLVSLRGDVIVTVAPCVDVASARAMATAATAEINARLPGVVAVWGISRPHQSPLDYHIAHREATLALEAARRTDRRDRAAVFDELGVIRFLLAPGSEPDLAEYVNGALGPILEYDRRHRSSLLKTLRAYLDTNCSLLLAAERLFVHHKTLRYRVTRIEELTHLDLKNNEDRFRADLALRILDCSTLRSSLDPE